MISEAQKIRKLFSELYNGNPWIEVTIFDSLKTLDYEKAKNHPISGIHSIWEIVNHLICWRNTMLKRLSGETITSPPNNFFEQVKDKSPDCWRETLSRFEQSNKDWLNFLENINDEDLNRFYPGYGYSGFELIYGILQHDAYHLGQIALLKKMID